MSGATIINDIHRFEVQFKRHHPAEAVVRGGYVNKTLGIELIRGDVCEIMI